MKKRNAGAGSSSGEYVTLVELPHHSQGSAQSQEVSDPKKRKRSIEEELEELEIFDLVEEMWSRLEDETNVAEHVYAVGESLSYSRFDPCPTCRYSEHVESLLDFEPQTTDNPLVKSDIAKSLADKIRQEIGGAPTENDEQFKKWLDQVMKFFTSMMEYDSVHANASRNWRSLAYTYMTADEALRLRRGICGELSLALVSVLRYLGLPASLYRPYFSHIAVVVENPSTGTKYILDPTSGIVEKYPSKTLIRKAKTEKSKYFYGPVRLEEFYETTVGKRRRLGRKYIGRNFTPEEALDYEYARHCLYPLPYGTERGRRFLDYLTRIGYCKRLFDARTERIEAEIFARIVASCPRPEDPDVPLEEKVNCYVSAWEKFEKSVEELRKMMRRVLESS